MDALREHDLGAARETPPEEKLRQALDLMQAGLALEREKLSRALPSATAEELEQAFEAWLLSRD